MKIVAVVVTYNRKKLLEECLEAILKQSEEIFKIVLVDNNSFDGTYEYLKEKKFLENSKIMYLKLEQNIGGAGGFHEGMKAAQKFQPDWLWIMDDDTIPTTNCLEELVKPITSINEKIGYLASSIYGENGEFMNVPHISQEISESGYQDWYKYLSKGIVKITTATFVSLLINNDAVKNIGLPVKDYFIWGDDTEYTLRLNRYYGRCYMIGKSEAIHKRKIAKTLSIYEEDNEKRIEFYYYKIRNTLINNRTYYGRKKAISYFIKMQLKSLKLLIFPNCKYRLKKFRIIHKALINYTLKNYNLKDFKNRFYELKEYNDEIK